MGGVGSGRRSGFGRDTVELCRSLDVNRLHRDGCLEFGWSGSWQWTRGGARVAWISLRAETGRIVLSYRYRRNGGDWQDVEEQIRITYVPCRYGGSRPYFTCPGIVNGNICGRRAVKVFGPGRYFLCRHCYRLAYTSQSEGAWDRAFRRAGKIRRHLGGDAGLAAPFPAKPKGMWWRTYERLREKAIAADLVANKVFVAQAERLLARTHDWKRKRRYFR